jgi:hypothetical protein
VAPVLLLAVALNQLRMVRTEHLSPWLGGGFAMFSTLDQGSNRQIRAFALYGPYEREIRPEVDLGDLERRARVHPTDGNLDRLVLALLDAAAVPPPVPAALRIEVWRASLDPETLAPRWERLRDHRVELRGGP